MLTMKLKEINKEYVRLVILVILAISYLILNFNINLFMCINLAACWILFFHNLDTLDIPIILVNILAILSFSIKLMFIYL